MAIQNLTLRQTMASFAYMAYCGEDITTPNPEQEILGLINAAMPKIPPIASPNATWRVVWGPAVYTMPGALYQDNMMFVVQNQSDTTQFAIAIRGTNAIADLDWLAEDFDILQMISWPTVSAGTTAPADAQISESTSIDLQILLAMEDQSTLLEFLKSQTAKPINLCVTGHSLGGCVAGTLALYLKENRGSWDSAGTSLVCCITFAAPTAGNLAFAEHSDPQFSNGGGQFPGWDASLGTNFDAVRCSLDVAPMAWIAAAVTVSPSVPIPPVLAIYGNNLSFFNLSITTYLGFTTALGFVCPAVVGIIAPRNYQQVVSGAQNVTGTFNAALSPSSNTLESYLQAFIAQAEYQHSDSYPSLLEVPQLNDPTIIVTDPGALLSPPGAGPTRRSRRVRFTPT